MKPKSKETAKENPTKSNRTSKRKRKKLLVPVG
jgi:hypothetical protein